MYCRMYWTAHLFSSAASLSLSLEEYHDAQQGRITIRCSSAQSICYGGKLCFAIGGSGLHALLARDAKTMLPRQFIYWSISWLDFHSMFLTLTTWVTFATLSLSLEEYYWTPGGNGTLLQIIIALVIYQLYSLGKCTNHHFCLYWMPRCRSSSTRGVQQVCSFFPNT